MSNEARQCPHCGSSDIERIHYPAQFGWPETWRWYCLDCCQDIGEVE